MIPLENLSLPPWKDSGKIILVPNSLGKCFWHTPLELPFHTPVWVKNGIAHSAISSKDMSSLSQQQIIYCGKLIFLGVKETSRGKTPSPLLNIQRMFLRKESSSLRPPIHTNTEKILWQTLFHYFFASPLKSFPKILDPPLNIHNQSCSMVGRLTLQLIFLGIISSG